MPGAYLLLFEILAYIQLALCVAHALKHGTPSLVRVAFAAVFGIFLEMVSLRQMGVFQYGRFLLMVGGIPLCVGLAWGSVMYAAMEFSDSTSLPRWQRPLLDGLLVLNVALALDPVAIRLGMWNWGRDPAAQFFGVPYAHFLSWYFGVATFSSVFRLPSHPKTGPGVWLSGPLAALTGLIVLIVVNAFMLFAIPVYYHALLTVLVTACAIIYIISLQPRFHQRTAASLVLLIPLIALLYVLIAGAVSGALFDPLALMMVAVVMLAVLLWIHWLRIKHVFARRADFAG